MDLCGMEHVHVAWDLPASVCEDWPMPQQLHLVLRGTTGKCKCKSGQDAMSPPPTVEVALCKRNHQLFGAGRQLAKHLQ